MIKLICLVLGLLIGFGGGVYWASHNPDAANQLSAQEEQRFLEAQMKITQQIQDKLDRLQGKASTPSPGAGLVSSAQSGANSAVKDVQADARQQQDEIRKRLEALKK